MGSSSRVNMNGTNIEITDGVIRINDKKVVYVDDVPTIEKKRASVSVFCVGVAVGLALSLIIFGLF